MEPSLLQHSRSVFHPLLRYTEVFQNVSFYYSRQVAFQVCQCILSNAETGCQYYSILEGASEN